MLIAFFQIIGRIRIGKSIIIGKLQATEVCTIFGTVTANVSISSLQLSSGSLIDQREVCFGPVGQLSWSLLQQSFFLLPSIAEENLLNDQVTLINYENPWIILILKKMYDPACIKSKRQDCFDLPVRPERLQNLRGVAYSPRV